MKKIKTNIQNYLCLNRQRNNTWRVLFENKLKGPALPVKTTLREKKIMKFRFFSQPITPPGHPWVSKKKTRPIGSTQHIRECLVIKIDLLLILYTIQSDPPRMKLLRRPGSILNYTKSNLRLNFVSLLKIKIRESFAINETRLYLSGIKKKRI